MALFLAPLSAAAQDTSYTFETIIYPGDTFTQLLGINNSGTIAGYHGATINKGFSLVPPSSFTLENFPKSAQTQVTGINTAGWTSGFYIDQQGNTHAFLNLQNPSNVWIYRTVTYPGTTFNQLLGLNDKNQAAGYYQDAAGNDRAYVYDENGGVFLLITISWVRQRTGHRYQRQRRSLWLLHRQRRVQSRLLAERPKLHQARLPRGHADSSSGNEQ